MSTAQSLVTRELSAATAAATADILSAATDAYGGVDNPDLIRDAADIAKMFPAELLSACEMERGGIGFRVIAGFHLDDQAIGPTPARWKDADPHRTADWDILMLLLAHVFGKPFGWSGQQDGRLVNNIVPSRGHEREQTGASSTVLLEPHTEDAFHPGRCHYLLLGGMRNHDDIGTTLSSVREVDLEPAEFVELASATVPILPDTSYEANPAAGALPAGAASSAPVVPTLWVGEDGLCLRYDPAYTPLANAPDRYRRAYGSLSTELARNARTVSLRAGEVLVIDNDVIVHGRVPFTPRYDGTDRWLKRINVRVPGKDRPAAEEYEDGYGEDVVDPLSAHPVYSERSTSK
ncbi:Fe(II)-2OG oxygenase family protein [Rhodococcus opacus]|uniref:TauD/TfdA family dioxygenase n=1 Tax=Rhodococcus opacus TaxID=37919 RepID=UPI00046CCE7A|nr:TauD/TfdA family dioxygenase [Rhodococcus opacus]UDH01325.1 TauD/TfdA family dioxygenase [Rhodococcus opacus PD630]